MSYTNVKTALGKRTSEETSVKAGERRSTTLLLSPACKTPDTRSLGRISIEQALSLSAYLEKT
jgi:hypothetical protein